MMMMMTIQKTIAPVLGTIHSLTGIRGIMALWVFFLHINHNSVLGPEFIPNTIPFLSTLLSHGYLGVDVFFMLSGIVMTMVYGAKLSTFNWQQTLYYYKLRWARMVPSHYTMLLVFWATYKVTEVAFHMSANTADKFNLRDLGLNLLLLQSYLPESITTWNLVSWSISTEFFAYLLFPLMACLILPLPRTVLLGLLPLLLIAFVGVFTFIFGGETNFINNVSLLKIIFEFLIAGIATQLWILPALRGEVQPSSLLAKSLSSLALLGFFVFLSA
jgi:peptidoglycan/LPS O-acetylase OafA/YrhL